MAPCPQGIEYWQPLFFDEPLPSLFSYLPAQTLLVNTGDLSASSERFWQDTEHRYENRRVDPMRPLVAPSELWLAPDKLNSELKKWPRVQLVSQVLPKKAANTNLGYQALPPLHQQDSQQNPLDPLRQLLEAHPQYRVIFSVESQGLANDCKKCWRGVNCDRR